VSDGQDHSHEHPPGHDHLHAHGHGAPIPRLRAALLITLAALAVEVVGGVWSGSLALLSDAGHMLADAGALALALAAQIVAARPRTERRTYGFRRAETLAAFLNGIALGVTAVFIVVEAAERWRAPRPVDGGLMLAVAIFGLLANLGSAAILARAAALPGIAIAGLQCHIGSQIRDLAPLGEAARELAALSRRLLADGLPLETLDLGGGLGFDYDGEGAPSPADFAAVVRPALDGLPLTLLLEPGRSLVAGAGVLLTRVLYLKSNASKAFVIVDAGMNDLLRPALYKAHHRIEPVAIRPGPPAVVDVVGPVCETGDFLARGRELPPVAIGDLLAVRDAGAYAFVMSSNYNMRPRAAEVLVEGSEARLIRRRETFDDLVRNEVE
jgi:hypothetical protein